MYQVLSTWSRENEWLGLRKASKKSGHSSSAYKYKKEFWAGEKAKGHSLAATRTIQGLRVARCSRGSRKKGEEGEGEPLQKQAEAGWCVILNGTLRGGTLVMKGEPYKVFAQVRDIIRCNIVKGNSRFQPWNPPWATFQTQKELTSPCFLGHLHFPEQNHLP